MHSNMPRLNLHTAPAVRCGPAVLACRYIRTLTVMT